MPELPIYRSNEVAQGGINSRASGSDFSSGSGISAFGQSLRGLEDFAADKIAHSEINSAGAQISRLQADFGTQVIGLKKSLTPEEQDNFLQNYESSMTKVSDGLISGKANDYFQRNFDVGRRDLQVALARKNSALAGAEAVQNLNTKLDSLTISVGNGTTGLGAAINDWTSYVRDSSNVDEAKKQDFIREKTKTLAQADFLNLLGQSTAVAAQALDQGKYKGVVDEAHIQHFESQLRAKERANRIDANSARIGYERAVKAQQNEVSKDFLTRLHQNTLTADAVLFSAQGQKLPPHQQEQFLHAIDSSMKKLGPIQARSAAALGQIYDQIMAPDTDPKKIKDNTQLAQAVAGKGAIVQAAIPHLQSLLEQNQNSEGSAENNLFSTALDKVRGSLINPPRISNGVAYEDRLGQDKYGRAAYDLQTAFTAEVKAGKNPIDLLTPGNPHYIVDKIARAHAKTPQEIMAEKVEMAKTGQKENQAAQMKMFFDALDVHHKSGGAVQAPPEPGIIKYRKEDGKPYKLTKDGWVPL